MLHEIAYSVFRHVYLTIKHPMVIHWPNMENCYNM